MISIIALVSQPLHAFHALDARVANGIQTHDAAISLMVQFLSVQVLLKLNLQVMLLLVVKLVDRATPMLQT